MISNQDHNNPAEAMAGGDTDARGAAAQASVLEKDLKDLERLLKADQAANGGAAGGDGARIKSQLRQVLRKLMEAYFNPLNGAYRSRDGRIAPPRISLLSHPLDLETVGTTGVNHRRDTRSTAKIVSRYPSEANKLPSFHVAHRSAQA